MTNDSAIKRPKSSYIFFSMSDERNKIIEYFKNRGIKFSSKEVLIELGLRWKNMSESDRQVYKNMAAEDKKRYEDQIGDNKYITGYQLYCNDNIQRVKDENPKLSGELGFKYIQILANEWKHLNKETTSLYNRRSDNYVKYNK